jgi:hypothetical protein
MLLKLLRRTAAAVGLLALAASPAHAEWLEAKSKHFTVIGNMSESELRARTVKLERFDSMLRHLLAPEATVPVTVYVLDGLQAVQDARGSSDVAAFYEITAQRAFIVTPEKLTFYVEDFNPNTVLQHEYTHHMLLANTTVFMPAWAQEGLAEMFSTARIRDDGTVLVGDKSDARSDEMLAMHRWTVRRLLASDLDPPKREEAIEKYSRGWAMSHYLWMSGERPGQYTKFIELLNQGVEPVKAGEQAFGDLDKLNRELNAYINRHQFKVSQFTPQELGPIGEIKVRPLGADEAAIVRSRIATSVGVTEKTAGPLADKARPIGAAYPNSLIVQETMAEILHDAKDYAGSDAAADRALAVDPNSLMGMVYKGRVAVRRALAAKDNAAVAQARSWFRRAARGHQESALPFMLYYDSFTAIGQTPPADAVAGIYQAVALVPQDSSLRVRAALELLRAGQVADARAIIAPVAFEAEGSGENSALKLVREMNATKDPQMLLAKARELKLDQINDFTDPPKEDKDKDKA